MRLSPAPDVAQTKYSSLNSTAHSDDDHNLNDIDNDNDNDNDNDIDVKTDHLQVSNINANRLPLDENSPQV